jgi:hypothetical protein
VRIVQPVSTDGDVARVSPLTMAAISPQIVAAGHATEEEAAAIVAEMERQAADPGALVGFPRIVQSWARV